MKTKLVEILACPVCLGKLKVEGVSTDSVEEGMMLCQECKRKYGIREGIPIFLLKDEQWVGTHTEMQGELEMVNEMPESEHIKRNRYESMRSWKYLKTIKIPEHPRVLDIGGSGGFGSYLLHRYKPEIVVVDIVPVFLKIARDFLGGHEIPNDVAGAGMEWLPFKDETFDVVLCRQALHHSYNPPQSIREMVRVAKTNGMILIVDEPCLSIGDKIKEYKNRNNKPDIKTIVNIQDKLRDAEFKYIWTDFHKAFAPLTKKFKIQRSIGFAANVTTPEGIIYTSNYRARGPLGKIMNRILPRGLGFRGDINIRAIKTKSVERVSPAPNYEVVSPNEIEFKGISAQQKQEYKILFPKFFDDVEW